MLMKKILTIIGFFIFLGFACVVPTYVIGHFGTFQTLSNGSPSNSVMLTCLSTSLTFQPTKSFISINLTKVKNFEEIEFKLN